MCIRDRLVEVGVGAWRRVPEVQPLVDYYDALNSSYKQYCCAMEAVQAFEFFMKNYEEGNEIDRAFLNQLRGQLQEAITVENPSKFDKFFIEQASSLMQVRESSAKIRGHIRQEDEESWDKAIQVIRRPLLILLPSNREASALKYICTMSAEAINTYAEIRENPFKLLFLYDCYHA